MAFGKLTNAFFSGTNENTLALANVNFDFTLMRFDPPKEFQKFGAALTQQRRDEAEEGSTHKTARRLGALFEERVPPTPKLIKAYGSRTSEIAASPKVNPTGSKNDGAFRPYVGADGTSIWAAATSQSSDAKAHGPLAVHLLACMLARKFKPDEATSIWVELVQFRQREILSKIDLEPVSITACMVARQDITRENLALWDTSARSWLATADEAKALQRTQLQLVVNNLHLQLSLSESTYEAVMEVWRQAMMGMEKCLNGTPQEVSDASILLALSSWHLYPDLIVPQDPSKKIAFNDPLLSQAGTIAIGLEFAPGSRSPGMHWSLTLSHLRYYGSAVEVESNSDIQRITIDQLLIMTFANLLSSWDIPRKDKDEIFVAEWLLALRGVIGQDGTFLTQPGDSFAWIRLLAESAGMFLRLKEKDPSTCAMLTGWGRRRCKNFLGSSRMKPFFGLLQPAVASALQVVRPLEAGIKFLRSLAADMGLKAGEAVIRFGSTMRGNERVEFATAVPHLRADQKRSYDGTLKTHPVHCRWVGINRDLSIEPISAGCACTTCDETCPCSNYAGKCGPGCHAQISNSLIDCITVGSWPAIRYRHISNDLVEDCCILHPRQTLLRLSEIQNPEDWSEELEWKWPPQVFHNHDMPTQSALKCPTVTRDSMTCHCFKFCEQPSDYYHNTVFKLLHGSTNGLGLYIRVRPEAHDMISNYRTTRLALNTHLDETIESEAALRPLDPGQAPPRLLLNALRHISGTYADSGNQSNNHYFYEPRDMFGLLSINPLPDLYLKSLTLLSYTYDLYKDLGGATISTDILGLRLYESKWLSHEWGIMSNFGQVLGQPTTQIAGGFGPQESLGASRTSPLQYPARPMNRAETFACIVIFESGVHNIESALCSPVIALAAANSIFVAAELLSDPVLQDRYSVRRVVGNVGKPGMSMLVLPQEVPRIRPLGNDWRAVAHRPFDNIREDNFNHTTLVLSFTEWKRPVSVIKRGNIDEDVNLVECFVSVHDRGTWVADLNPMDLNTCSTGFTCHCQKGSELSFQEVTAIDSWEELLDAPENLGIVRSRDNWVARLSAAAIRRQQGKEEATCIVPPNTELCHRCFATDFERHHVGAAGVGIIID